MTTYNHWFTLIITLRLFLSLYQLNPDLEFLENANWIMMKSMFSRTCFKSNKKRENNSAYLDKTSLAIWILAVTKTDKDIYAYYYHSSKIHHNVLIL